MPQLPGRQSWDWMAWPRGKIERMARAASVNVSTTLATGHDMQNMQATPQSNMAGPIQAAGFIAHPQQFSSPVRASIRRAATLFPALRRTSGPLADQEYPS